VLATPRTLSRRRRASAEPRGHLDAHIIHAIKRKVAGRAWGAPSSSVGYHIGRNTAAASANAHQAGERSPPMPVQPSVEHHSTRLTHLRNGNLGVDQRTRSAISQAKPGGRRPSGARLSMLNIPFWPVDREPSVFLLIGRKRQLVFPATPPQRSQRPLQNVPAPAQGLRPVFGLRANAKRSTDVHAPK